MIRKYHVVVAVHDTAEKREAIMLVIGEDLLWVQVVDRLKERREDVEARGPDRARDVQREVLQAVVDAGSDDL